MAQSTAFPAGGPHRTEGGHCTFFQNRANHPRTSAQIAIGEAARGKWPPIASRWPDAPDSRSNPIGDDCDSDKPRWGARRGPRPAKYSAGDDLSTIELLKKLNSSHLEKFPGDANLAARVASYELAGQMQMSVPEIMNLGGEPESIHKEYGTDTGSDLKREYAKNCILTRRFIEKGVRVVQLFNGSDPSGGNGITNWDSHSDSKETHAMQAEIMDQPTAALIRDMKRRVWLQSRGERHLCL